MNILRTPILNAKILRTSILNAKILRTPILKNICKRLLPKQKRFNMTIHFPETNGTFFFGGGGVGLLGNMESLP